MIGAGIEGDLAAIIDRRIDMAAAAVTDAVAIAGQRLRQELADRTRAAGLGNGLARSWRLRLYPGGGRLSLGAAALVYTKAPEILEAHSKGITIRPTGGRRYLAVPTGYNKPFGRRKASGGGLITVRQMVELGRQGMAFTRPIENGTEGLVWFLRVTHAQTRDNSGRVRDRAFAGGMALGGRIRGDLGSGRRKRVAAILESGAVPMYLLLPQVTLKKKLDVATAAAEARAALPGLVAARLRRIAGEA